MWGRKKWLDQIFLIQWEQLLLVLILLSDISATRIWILRHYGFTIPQQSDNLVKLSADQLTAEEMISSRDKNSVEDVLTNISTNVSHEPQTPSTTETYKCPDVIPLNKTVTNDSQNIPSEPKWQILSRHQLKKDVVILLGPDQQGDNKTHVWVELPKAALNSSQVEINFATYKVSALSFLSNYQPTAKSSAPGHRVSRIINSDIVSVSVGDAESVQLNKGYFIKIYFEHLVIEDVKNATCVYWSFSKNDWSEEGCFLEQNSSNKTHSVCKCNHLTNFAILMDVHGVEIDSTNELILGVITYVGCSISIVCLVIAIAIFQLFEGLKSDKTTIHKNLCICLLIAEVLFIGGVDQTSQKVVCSIVAGLLHFFLLCAFAWMLIEGIQLYTMLIHVFERKRSRIRWYYIFAYGLPLIVVAVSSAIHPRGYGTEKYCWLKTTDYFIFSFVGPVIVVLMANFGVLFTAIYVMYKHANTTISVKNKKDHSQVAAMRVWLKGAIVLIFLLGLTWTFGLLFINRQTLVMAYIFTALNSLQGLFIFIFHCLLNKQVRKEYRKFIRRHSWMSKWMCWNDKVSGLSVSCSSKANVSSSVQSGPVTISSRLTTAPEHASFKPWPAGSYFRSGI